MDRFAYLKALRRFKWVIIAAVVVGLGAAWFVTALESDATSVRPAITYAARTYLISTETESGFIPRVGPTSPATAAALLKIEPIPSSVKEAIDFQGSASALANLVTPTVDENTAIMQIEAVSRTAATAAEISTAFADELLRRLADMKLADAEELEADLKTQIDTLEAQIAETDEANESQLIAALEQAKAESRALRTEPPDPGFAIINDRAEIEPIETSGGFQAPRSFGARAPIAIALGLLGGVGIALLLGRYDTKIRTKEDAEERFGTPVLAEIPKDRYSRRGLVMSSDTGTGSAEAFRVLAAEILQGGPVLNGGRKRPSHDPRALLITSPGPSDGKTTVVGNLAVALAEADRTVLILSCDFRRPRIHELFGVSNQGLGLAEALRTNDPRPMLEGITWDTGYERIRIVPGGTLQGHPIESLSSASVGRAVAEAKRDADFVIIDTAPLLAVSDATLLLPHADAVLVVARAGRTTSEVATSCAELLRRSGANVIGVALSDAAETIRPKGYRSYAYQTAGPGQATKDAITEEPDGERGADG